MQDVRHETPAALEAERSALGSCLLAPEGLWDVYDVLGEDAAAFHAEPHRVLYETLLTLLQTGRPVDITTVMETLQGNGTLEKVGGASYIGELTGAVPVSANAGYYAEIVKDRAVRRRFIESSGRLVQSAYDCSQDSTAFMETVEREVFALAEQNQRFPIVSSGEARRMLVRALEGRGHGDITGISTGYTALDRKLGGLQRADLIVLAARPSVGKTALALNLARHAALNGHGVLFVSLEMTAQSLMERMISMESRVGMRKVRTGWLPGDLQTRVDEAGERLAAAPLWIDDAPGQTPTSVRSRAKRHTLSHQLGLIIVDYLQLMDIGKRAESRQTEVAAMSRAMKALARELNVPVVVLSQLNREMAKSGEGRPQLHHLKESGAIEQDADVVLLLWQAADDGEATIRLDVAKQRNGPTGEIPLVFLRDIQWFESDGQPLPAMPPPKTDTPPPPPPSGDWEYSEDDDNGIPF